MVIATNREHLDNGSLSGCRVRGLARLVIDPAGTARTLLVGESGALCLLGTAAGQAYTLPAVGANDVGMYFDFLANITGTGTYSITTDAATTFLVGAVDYSSTSVAEGGDTFVADGVATTVDYTADSDVTGRLVGTSLRLTAISSTQWTITGNMMGVGTGTTPF